VHQLGFNDVRIVGHDIGLMVAYAYAAQYPARSSKVVLMDAFCRASAIGRAFG